jgi:hypothetical protein
MSNISNISIIQETNIDQNCLSDNNIGVQPINEEIIHSLEIEIKDYLKKLNEDIGFYWWKYYTYCAFWSNISVPINLTITILTALTTGQTATGSLINNETSTIFGIVVLIISIFNTFFRPTQQLNDNEDFKKKWADLGTKFEIQYYNKIHSSNEIIEQEKKVEELFKEVGAMKRDMTNNYFIDFIFMVTNKLFIRDDITWINKKTFKKKMRGDITDTESFSI